MGVDGTSTTYEGFDSTEYKVTVLVFQQKAVSFQCKTKFLVPGSGMETGVSSSVVIYGL